MGTYVMSDLHGCVSDLERMLEKICFSRSDRLILAGDYVDRGPDTYGMLQWLEKAPENVTLLCGNHDEAYAEYVEAMMKEAQGRGEISGVKLLAIYSKTLRRSYREGRYFDYYGTIEELIKTRKDLTLDELVHFGSFLRTLPYIYETLVGTRRCIIVHAGYIDSTRYLVDENTVKEFCLFAREEALTMGGIPHGMVIAGHTPTIAEGYQTYTGGKVFRYYNQELDCIFYDIDCGCVFRDLYGGQLAALRLEDEEIFYV